MPTRSLLQGLLALGVTATLASVAWGTPPEDFEVPLIVQEILPRNGESPGNRTQELVTMGIPLSEDSGVDYVGQLGMCGVTAAKFTALARWESGGVKWVLCDFLADVPSNGANNSIKLTAGGGGFGGPHLATEEPTQIVVNTGPAQFVIPKSSFNVFTRVVVDGVELISPSNTGGIVAYDFNHRPFFSRHDPSPEVTVENNGPVKSIVTVKGRHTNTNGEGFLDYTLRMEFVKGKRDVACSYTMRNARFATNQHARSRGIELDLALNLPGIKRFAFGTHTGTPVEGAIQGNQNAYYYQAASSAPQGGANENLWVPPLPRQNGQYLDTGYKIGKGSNLLVNETDPAAWPAPSYADLTDAQGRGVTFGIRFLPRLWPGALECNGDGSVKVGIFTKRTNHYYTWNFGVHETRQFFLSFHTQLSETEAETVRDKALAFQFPIKARPQNIDYLNRTGVFSDQLISVEDENRFFELAGLNYQKRVRNTNFASLRYYNSGQGGGGNQTDKSYHGFFEWMRTGSGGLYLDSEMTALYRSDWATFHSDDWVANYVNDPRFAPAPPISNHEEFPTTRKHVFDNQHCHNRHQPVWYYFTGDPRYRDSFLDNMEGRVFSPKTKVVSLRTTGTRIFARTSWLLMEAYRFAADINAVNGFAFNRDYAPPMTKEEIYEIAKEYLRWGMDQRYFRDGSGWSDEPLQGDNDSRHFWAGGKNRYLYEEVIFHLANLYPDALYNIHHLSPANSPLLKTIKQRIVDLNTFVWTQNIVGHCETDATRRGNYYRYFTFDRGTGAVPPAYPGCGGATPDSGSYDNHPCYALFIGAHKLTEDPIYLKRARNFVDGQLYNGGFGRNGERTDYQSAIYRLLRGLEEQTPPKAPSNLRAVHVGDHIVRLQWDEPPLADDGECVHKYVIYRNGALVDGWTRTHLDDLNLLDGTQFTYRIHAVDPWSVMGPAARITVTTSADQTRPRVESLRLPNRSDQIIVRFSEPVQAQSASDVRNYRIDGNGGLNIHSATLDPKDPQEVVLQTDAHLYNRTYSLSVENVRDRGATPLSVVPGEAFSYESVYYVEDFNDGVADDFYPVEGNWRVVNGYYEKSGGDWKARTLLRNRPFGDFTAEFHVSIPDRQREEWAAMTLRTKSLYTWPHGGYLVYFNNRGNLAVHNERGADNLGSYVEIPDTNPTGWHHIKVTAVGPTIQVFFDGALYVNWTDPNGTFVADWINFHAMAPIARFDNLRIGPPDFTTFSSATRKKDGPNRPRQRRAARQNKVRTRKSK